MLGPKLEKSRLGANNITFVTDGVSYAWEGGFGAVISSEERKLKVGDVRNIFGILFSVNCLHHSEKLWHKKVCWAPVERFDAEWIRAFKSNILGN